jgi:nitroreductase
MSTQTQVEQTVFETILARRSVRYYNVRQVESSTINILLEAAVKAPSSRNQDALGFIVIQDKALINQISEQTKSMFKLNATHDSVQHIGYNIADMNDPNFNIFHHSGTLVLICAHTLASYYVADCWLAAENLMLAGTAMGLGTCIISSALPTLQLPEMRKRLNLPDNFSIIVPIVVGYSDQILTRETSKKPNILANITSRI